MLKSSIPTYWLKAGVAVALVALADRLFLFHEIGSTLGVFALAWVGGLAIARPGMVRDPRALGALAGAAAMGLVLLDRPHPLAWLLMALGLTVAALSARVARGAPVWRWVQKLAVHGVLSVFGPIIDLARMDKHRRRKGVRSAGWGRVRLLILPVVGSAVFLTLFAQANPLIGDALAKLRLPELTPETIGRVICWGLILIAVGAVLRPRWIRKTAGLPSLGDAKMPGVTGQSIVLSLVAFNALFALQNGLDVAFLWSGAPLPGEMTLASYAHRGAYPLIVTALLAGLFVLVALRPGSETAGRPLVRRLVTVWIGQNMLLVASSILRTADYVAGYGLTRFRIAALIWMAMVGVGLLLICWRMLRGRDGNWLIDANVKLALAVLAMVSAVDLGAVAANWNVRHATEAGGGGVELDLGYLRQIGSPALVSLVELEQRTRPGEFRDRVTYVRQKIMADTLEWQGGRGWAWRNARRLGRIGALTADHPLPVLIGERDWDGRHLPPPPPPSEPWPAPPAQALSAPAPLTSASGD